MQQFDSDGVKIAYLDEGEGEIILCLHGQPSWSYLYRKMIPLLTGAGYRVIAPDLIGFGRSDKPTERSNYTYANHVFWLKGFIDIEGAAARYVIQAVGPRINGYFDRPWAPGEKRGSALVVIGLHGFDEAAITRAITA